MSVNDTRKIKAYPWTAIDRCDIKLIWLFAKSSLVFPVTSRKKMALFTKFRDMKNIIIHLVYNLRILNISATPSLP